jgi:predicted CXXCH cytochrome family protein
MRTGIGTKNTSGTYILLTTLLLSSLLAVNTSEASNPVRDYVGETGKNSAEAATETRKNLKTRTCLMADQLKDPVIRADYDTLIDDSERTGLNRTVLLDPISMECLACHDGTLAKAVNHRISDGDIDRVKSIETIKGAHPVGMNYDSFARSKEYVPSKILAANIILINGRVGCVSCHNLLGKNDKYLVVENTKSGLCFSCHYK